MTVPRLPSEAGFSLVETVAAMAVLAIAALPLMQVAGDAANNTGRLETRLLARMVAENEMSYVMSEREPLDAGLSTGISRQLERAFEWTLVAGPAVPGETQSLEMTVRQEDRPQVLTRLVSLKAIPLPVQDVSEDSGLDGEVTGEEPGASPADSEDEE
ncbi:MAG: type II secretion system minor pseudopilin GspI [Henriciella sp.]|nr:type II secretion system minor pseudopilin GspI [Henriciella sp.]